MVNTHFWLARAHSELRLTRKTYSLFTQVKQPVNLIDQRKTGPAWSFWPHLMSYENGLVQWRLDKVSVTTARSVKIRTSSPPSNSSSFSQIHHQHSPVYWVFLFAPPTFQQVKPEMRWLVSPTMTWFKTPLGIWCPEFICFFLLVLCLKTQWRGWIRELGWYQCLRVISKSSSHLCVLAERTLW